MKKLKLNGKLTLNKETISRLDSAQMNAAKGGGILSIGAHCTHAHNTCYGTDQTQSLFCGPGPHN